MSSPVIRPLSEAVINQIAAGEVVERPVSIIKELIENSLDAGASQIEIEIEDGGIRRLLVRDNGCGIPRDQLGLALTRHCTSKLSSSAELERLMSLGFRGEALAAIDSVSTLSLSSRTAGDAHAWQLAGGILAPTAHPVGSSVEVRDLFGRVPARRRFLRQPQTEWLHIQLLVRRIAFCTPLVSFSVWHEGQRVLNLPAARDEVTATRRLRALFGAEFAAAARPVERANDRLRVFGFVAGPELARSQNDLQMLAVNQRVIRDRHLSHAVRLAFDDKLPEGRQPCYALQLEMVPEEVDVNVHPGKLEVRFRELREVHDLVLAAVRNVLDEPAQSLQDSIPYRPALRPVRPPRLSTGVRDGTGAVQVREAGGDLPGTPPTNLAGRYVLRVSREGLTIVDGEALIAAVLQQRFAQDEQTAGRVVQRPVLFPIRVECPDSEEATRVASTLEALGFDVPRLAPAVLALRCLPIAVAEVDPGQLGQALATRGTLPAVAWLATAMARGLLPLVAVTDDGWQRWHTLAVAAGLDPTIHTRRLDVPAIAALFAS